MRGFRFSEMVNDNDGRYRSSVHPGLKVGIIQKRDQQTVRLTYGIVSEILTNSSYHPHGIKVRLTSGHIGRVGSISFERNG